MKHYSIDWLIKKNRLREAGDAIPKPFPGRYPTRIAYRVSIAGRKGTVDYCGKPNVEAFRRLQNLMRAGNKYIFFEFDRKGLITVHSSKGDKSRTHTVLHRIYHPFSGSDPMYTFRQKWFSKKISGFVAYYSPVEKLKRDQLDGHKQWLRLKGLLPKEEGKKKSVDGRTYRAYCAYCEREEIVESLPMGPLLLSGRCSFCGAGSIRYTEINGL